jgi:uncharacterized protein
VIGYFDSSALVKLLIEEEGSNEAAALWDGADVVLGSRVGYPEVRAALASAHRDHRLTDDQLQQARGLWEDFWGALRLVDLTEGVARRAGDLSEEHALSGADAIHLASAELLTADGPVVATWDSRLHAAVSALGLAVLPASGPFHPEGGAARGAASCCSYDYNSPADRDHHGAQNAGLP